MWVWCFSSPWHQVFKQLHIMLLSVLIFQTFCHFKSKYKFIICFYFWQDKFSFVFVFIFKNSKYISNYLFFHLNFAFKSKLGKGRDRSKIKGKKP